MVKKDKKTPISHVIKHVAVFARVVFFFFTFTPERVKLVLFKERCSSWIIREL